MQLDPAALDQLASRVTSDFAQHLLNIATPDRTEADFRREVARLLDHIVSEAQILINVREEYHVARGRVDAVYNRLVIEYERPGTLSERLSDKSNQHAIQQVKDYILGVAKRERREAHRLAGVAMDGRYFIFVRRVGEGWAVEERRHDRSGRASHANRRATRLYGQWCLGDSLSGQQCPADGKIRPGGGPGERGLSKSVMYGSFRCLP